MIFALPGAKDEHLAYVKWFTKFSAPDPNHGMLKVNHALDGQERITSVVPVSSIRRSIHLIPKFGPNVLEHWTSVNVLEECGMFYLNQFSENNRGPYALSYLV